MKDKNQYITYDRKTVGSSVTEAEEHYSQGYIFTRLGKGVMDQTKSVRVDLSKFELTSENRRVLRKTEGLDMEFESLPLEDYTWEIHKLGKDFYEKKFGDTIMSASKIKELFNDMEKSNMNSVIKFKYNKNAIGYCLCFSTQKILHYSYPFYDLGVDLPNLGMGMMVRAVEWAKQNSKEFIYLGSLATPNSKYKLQFKGVEVWDKGWG